MTLRNSYLFIVLGALCLLCIEAYLLYNGQQSNLETLNYLLSAISIGLVASSYFKYAIPAIIIMAPLSVNLPAETLGFKISFPTEIFTLILFIIASCQLLYYERFDKKILKHPISILLITDLSWTLITALTSTDITVSAKRFVLKLVFISIYFFAFSHWFKDKKNTAKLYSLYGIGLLYPIIHTLIYHANFDFSQQVSFAAPMPFYMDHTIYGACLGIVFPFFLVKIYRNNRINYFALSITLLLFAAIILSYSRATWICLVLIGISYLAIKFGVKAKHFLLIIALGTFTLITQFDTIFFSLQNQETTENDDNVADHLGSVTNLNTDASNLERINRWVAAYNMFLEKPLTGFGPGTYQFEYAPYQEITFKTRISTNSGNRGHAHSEYLGSLAETGLVGLMIFLALIFTSLHYGITMIKKNGGIVSWIATLTILSFIIQGTFNGFLDYEKMAILVYGSMAIIATANYEQAEYNDWA